jgi:hypothetical protein
VVVKTGCVLGPLAVVTALLAFVGSKNYENQRENAAAYKIWLSLCEHGKLYESGTFEDWDKIYSDIGKGRFPDSVHLIQPLKNGMPEDLWNVQSSDRVFLSKYTVSFMESDDKMIVRDPQFREWRFGLNLLALPYRDRSCIYENHKKLYELLWY